LEKGKYGSASKKPVSGGKIAPRRAGLYRKGRTVQRLFAGLWALAAQSGAPAILAAVGTASNQDRLFAIFGAKMLDNAGSVHSALFDDKLRLALFSVDRNAPPDYPELEQMQEFIARSHIGLQTTVAA
jgi:hypothetical protein